MLLGLVAYGLRRYVEPQQLTPDGRIYLAARQARPPRPYCLRWLLPALMGERDWRWLTGAALVLTCPALAWFLDLRGCADWQQLVGVGLWCGLNGVWRLPAIYPVLTDAPAMLLALTAADLALAGHGLAALACAVVAGACHEKAPIF
ncbi:MAG: hypothetical protein KBA95_12685, partial [Acidobacteria bacterium]|nr:hypothetical protein [Acidobacteriota bacterium]